MIESIEIALLVLCGGLWIVILLWLVWALLPFSRLRPPPFSKALIPEFPDYWRKTTYDNNDKRSRKPHETLPNWRRRKQRVK